MAAVGALGLVLGAAISGRPQGVPNDVIVTRPPAAATTTTTSTPDPPPPRSAPATTTTTTARATSTTSTTRTLRVTTTSSSTVAVTALTTVASTGASTVPGPTLPLAPESGLRLVVANATDEPGLAARTLAVLRTLGYSDSVPTDAVTPRTDTVIVHVDGRSGEAMRLATQLGLDPSNVRPRRSERLTVAQDDADLWLLLGADRS